MEGCGDWVNISYFRYSKDIYGDGDSDRQTPEGRSGVPVTVRKETLTANFKWMGIRVISRYDGVSTQRFYGEYRLSA